MARFNPRSVLTLTGAASLFGAAVSAEIAWLHMHGLAATYGVICGSGATPHCAACPAAMGLLAMGLAALAGAAGTRRASAGIAVGTRRAR